MGLSEASQPTLKALIEAGIQKASSLDQPPPDSQVTSEEVSARFCFQSVGVGRSSHCSSCCQLEEARAALRTTEEENKRLREETEGLKAKTRKAEEQLEDLNHTVSLLICRWNRQHRRLIPDFCICLAVLFRSSLRGGCLF